MGSARNPAPESGGLPPSGAPSGGAPIRVLVVDDSALVRRVLSQELGKFDDVEVVGTAVDAYSAREKIAKLRPDVLTLDVEMPGMDGLTFLEQLMRHYPLPVVVVSSTAQANSENAMRAFQLGAVEVVPKPGSVYSTPDVAHLLIRAVRAAAHARLPRAIAAPAVSAPVVIRPRPTPPSSTSLPVQAPRPAAESFPRLGAAPPRPAGPPAGSVVRRVAMARRILAIGASTGGTRAIEVLLQGLPADCPGTVVVQHMPAGFTDAFARRLDRVCPMSVREAADGDEVVPGLVLIAPGGKHMLLRRNGGQYTVQIKDGPPVRHQRPSVDVLFQSVAASAGRSAVGVLLTGMGADGAQGLLAMRERGATTLAEDESTCVVFGMPMEAIKLGGASRVVPLHQMALAIERLVTPDN